MTIEEIRACQALILEYIAFFLAERRGLNLPTISEQAVHALERDIDRLVADRPSSAGEGTDIARLVGDWWAYEEQIRLEQTVQRSGGKGRGKSPTGWLLRALARRRLRQPYEGLTPAP